jgi:hypothetical protein
LCGSELATLAVAGKCSRARKECGFKPSPGNGDFVAIATVAHATEFFTANRLTLLRTHVFLGSMLQRHTTANADPTAAPDPARVAASLLVLVLITSPNSAGRTDA